MYSVTPDALSKVTIFRMLSDHTARVAPAFFYVSETREAVRDLGLKTGFAGAAGTKECVVDLFALGSRRNGDYWIGATVSESNLTHTRTEHILSTEIVASGIANPPVGIAKQPLQRAVRLGRQQMALSRRACELAAILRYQTEPLSLTGPSALRKGRSTALQSLSARERELLRLLASGKSNKEIASELQLSPRTVEHYRARLMAKLQLKSFAGVVLFAVRSGLAEP